MTATYAGAEAGEMRYKAWGETRYTSGTSPTTYRYTGQREEASFGLYYYGARWYDPDLGRFIQADSIVPQGVQGLDRYAYVNNNPLAYVDPSGHSSKLPPQYWPSFTIPVRDGWDILASLGCLIFGGVLPVHYESGGLGEGYIVSNTPAQEIQKNVIGLGVVIIGGSTASTSSIDELTQTDGVTISDINNDIDQLADDVSE